MEEKMELNDIEFKVLHTNKMDDFGRSEARTATRDGNGTVRTLVTGLLSSTEQQ
jgi:hypothetical protein